MWAFFSEYWIDTHDWRFGIESRGSGYYAVCDMSSPKRRKEKISGEDEGILVFWKKLWDHHSRLIILKILSSNFSLKDTFIFTKYIIEGVLFLSRGILCHRSQTHFFFIQTHAQKGNFRDAQLSNWFGASPFHPPSDLILLISRSADPDPINLAPFVSIECVI